MYSLDIYYEKGLIGLLCAYFKIMHNQKKYIKASFLFKCSSSQDSCAFHQFSLSMFPFKPLLLCVLFLQFK